jgi:hypothetical protein
MRTLLTALILLAFLPYVSGQIDFKNLDQKTFDYYNAGDYKNLKKAADSLLTSGIDYYYLRMRLGLTAFNKKRYSDAVKDLTKALGFNSLDTISREYIYYSYLLSGRSVDANLYLASLPENNKNSNLSAVRKPGVSGLFAGYAISGSDVNLYSTNDLNYETISHTYNLSAGFETYFKKRLKATIVYTNFRKTGKIYSPVFTQGRDLDLIQNQVYGKLAGYIFPGWEISLFGHTSFFSETVQLSKLPFERYANQPRTEFIAGAGLAKNGWKLRAGVNVSFSNFSYSNQVRGEGYVSILPMGNLNLYLTSGGMIQTDNIWGNTYQFNEELGFSITRFLWFESGIVFGNSFLYSRNQGFIMNNSYLIPATSVYCNIIALAGKRIRIKLSPFYSENWNYSWDFSVYKRTNRLEPKSNGIAIKLNYNF